MRTRNTIAALAGALALAAPVATAATAQAATPVHYKSFACHTHGKHANPDVHGTVKYGYKVVKGKVVPVSARFVGTTHVDNPQPKGRSQSWTYANSTVSRDNGSGGHTSSANPVTYQARYGYLPKAANDTTLTGRWTYRGPGGTHTVPCTARVYVAAPKAKAAVQPVGNAWDSAPRFVQVGNARDLRGKGGPVLTVQPIGTKWTVAPTGKTYAV